MDVRIKRVDKTLPLPAYETAGAAAFDLYARLDTTIPAHEAVFLPTNVIVETPTGYMLMLAARSSLFRKTGLQLTNSIGIVDQDYCGDDDEISLHVQNTTSQPVHIVAGQRLAQGCFVKIAKATFIETNTMNQPSRGGFGSTGM